MRVQDWMGMDSLAVVGVAQGQEVEAWNAKVQSTYVWQAKPAIRSPYEGAYSLQGAREKSYSFTATAAFGLRVGKKTELYVDPEVAQGVPLSGLVGLAGFTNGEMARTSEANPTVYRAVCSRGMSSACPTRPKTSSLDAVRTTEQSKVGIGVNLEQTFSSNFGVFLRAMWADGQTETYAFTEADRSLSFGGSAKGALWGRPADTLGVALAGNMLSTSHRQILERGGLTFFLGDGRLHDASEQIFETYYAFAPVKGLVVSFDFQRIRNPGYNADRGPASFFGVRLHVEN